MTLRDIADGINRHLKRLEREGLLPGLANAGAYYMGGARIRITYVSREGGTTMSRPRAVAYLDWLNAGHIGRHEPTVAPNPHATTRRLDGPR